MVLEVFSGFAISLQIRKDGKSPSMPRTPSPRTMAADPQMKGKKLVLEKIGQKVRQIAQKCTLLAPKMGQCLLFHFFLLFFDPVIFCCPDFFFVLELSRILDFILEAFCTISHPSYFSVHPWPLNLLIWGSSPALVHCAPMKIKLIFFPAKNCQKTSVTW